MLKLRPLGWLFLVLLLALLAAAPVSAQFSSAIQGTVTDSQQGVVAQATVRVTNTTTNVTREATTSVDGVYRVLSLGPGSYRIEVEKAGFLKAQREAVTVGISETARLDFALEVSGVQESVTVASGAPLVETEQGRVSGRVDRHAAAGDAAQRQKPVQPDRAPARRHGQGRLLHVRRRRQRQRSFAGESAPRINASGQRDEANSFTVDDTSTNGVARGGITNLTPNTESVEEVRVVANNFSAVDGRNSGAQIQVITKAGTNEFRGSASHYFQNDALSAATCSRRRSPTSRRTSSATRSAARSSATACSSSRRTKASASPAGGDPRSRWKRPSSATSSPRHVPTASPPSC